MFSGIKTATVLACTASVVFIACTGGPSVSNSDVLASLVPSVVIPVHQTTANTLQSLNEAVSTACDTTAAPDLEKTRDAWRAARSSVSRSRSVEFGPVADRHSSSLIDWETLDSERVDDLLADGAPVTASQVREFMPATARGLRAFEYIAFADTDIDESRCAYLIAISKAAAEEAIAVVDEWTGTGTATGNEPYADVFTGTASSSLLPLSAVSDVVSTSIFLIRSIVDMQLGSALGIDGEESDLTAIGEGMSGNGVSDLRDAVVGMRAVYHGALPDASPALNGEDQQFGIGDLVAGASQAADVRVRETFKAAIDSIDALLARDESLTSLIVNDRAAAMEIYAVLKDLQLTLNTEVVSLLGISVGFADTDGDSG